MKAIPRLLRLTEETCWVLGLAGLAWWGTFQAGAITSAKNDLLRFAAFRQVVTEGTALDQSLWSPERVAAWHKAIRGPAPLPLAVLRIARIRLEVPVLPGTDDVTLDRGVGHIEGTAAPDAEGNIGIAGHRDGFFRGLKDIRPGDLIELVTVRDTFVYRVEQTWVVDPTDVSVLDPTPGQVLTLVTCFPFYFVGSAPQRFIVRAVPTGEIASQLIAERVQKWRE
jgi:sortase A